MKLSLIEVYTWTMVAGLFSLGLLLAACSQEPVGPSAPETQLLAGYLGAAPPEAHSRLGKGSITAMAYSPDGTVVAIGSETGLYLYDAATLDVRWQVPVTSPLISAAFSPDGRLLASGDENGKVTLVGAEDGRIVSQSSGNLDDDNGVTALAWTDGLAAAGGLQLAAGFNDGSVTLSHISAAASNGQWQVALDGSLERQSSGVTALAYNPIGNILASGNRTGVIDLWDARTLAWVGSLKGHDLAQAVLDLAWSPDGRRLLSGSRDGTVILWDVLSFSALHRLANQNDDVFSVVFTPDGRYAVSASLDGQVLRWPVDDSEETPVSGLLDGEVLTLAWSPDRQQLITVLANGDLEAWDLDETGLHGPQRILKGHAPRGKRVAGLAWSPDGKRLAAGRGNEILLWDVETSLTQILPEGHTSLVTAIDWSPDGDRFVSAGSDNRLIIWDAAAADSLMVLSGHEDGVADVAWSPDGRRLASAGSLDDSVIIWDGETGRALHRLTGQGSGLWSVAWSPDGGSLAAGTTLGEILFWQVDGSEVGPANRILRRHLNWVAALTWSPDGRRLASAGADNRVVLTDLESEMAVTYPGHSAAVRGLAFDPAGDRLASAAHDKSVIVWDVKPEAGKEPIAILTGHTDGANVLSWSPDGALLASGSDDGTVIIWDMR